MSSQEIRSVCLRFNEKRPDVSLEYDGLLKTSRLIKNILKNASNPINSLGVLIIDEAKLGSLYISPAAIEKLTVLDEGTGRRKCLTVLPVDFSGIAEYCECIIAAGCLGLDSVIEEFRVRLLDALNVSEPREAARELLGCDDDVLDKDKVNVLFKEAWDMKNALNDNNDDDNDDDDDDDDNPSGQSFYGQSNKILIRHDKKTSFVPKNILDKREKNKTADSKKCHHSGCDFVYGNNFFTKGFAYATKRNCMHHCRSCGLPICDKHSKKIVLPYKLAEIEGKNDNENDEQYVCEECFDFINSKKQSPIVCLISCAIAYLGLPLHYAARAAWISDEWNDACLLYWNSVKIMQLKSPEEPIADYERNFLWFNRKMFSGHCYWIMLLLRAIDWDDPFEVEEAKKIVTSEKKIECEKLECKQTCSKGCLRSMDAIPLLNGRFYPKVAPDIRRYFVDIVGRSPTSELLGLIFHLVYFTKYEPCVKVPLKDANEADLDKSPLTYMLFARAATPVAEIDGKKVFDRKFSLEVYWAIRACMLAKGEQMRFEVMKGLFMTTLRDGDPEFSEMLSNEELFIGELQRITNELKERDSADNVMDEVKTEKEDICKRLNEFLEKNPVFVPYDPYKIIKSIVNAKRFNSNARPLMLECEYIDNSPQPQVLEPEKQQQQQQQQQQRQQSPPEINKYVMSGAKSKIFIQRELEPPKTVKFIYKPENLIRDSFVTKFLVFVRRILSLADFDQDDLEVYNVIPVDANTGFIEMLYGKPWEETDSVSDYLVRNTKCNQDAYKSSVVAWTVLAYIIGFGDRHKENIMITDSGHFAHIDFGFIFGDDPHKLIAAASQRIPKEVIMKEDEEQIKEMSERIFILIRRYAPHVLSFFSSIEDFGVCNYRNVEKHLHLDTVDKEAGERVRAYVTDVLNREETIRDAIHTMGRGWSSIKSLTWSSFSAFYRYSVGFIYGNNNNNGNVNDDNNGDNNNN